MRSITGAILIGGRSARMGTPKHQLKLPDGCTMLDRACETLLQVCGDIVIVDAAGSKRSLPHRVIEDSRTDQGPLGGIEGLLASGLDREYLVCPCDMPLMTVEVLRMLLENDRAMATVLRLAHRQEPESLPMRLSATALPGVQSLLDQGQRSIWGLIKALPARIAPISSDWEKCFVNLNSPGDLATLGQ
jgi:molybdenum cofactor guanylyltransferase